MNKHIEFFCVCGGGGGDALKKQKKITGFAEYQSLFRFDWALQMTVYKMKNTIDDTVYC